MYIDLTIDDITNELLKYLIGLDLESEEKRVMNEADRYYNVKNSKIIDRRKMMMLYEEVVDPKTQKIDEVPYLKEDFSKANNKAKHSYLQELINQCTNYLTGKPIKLDYKKKITNKDKELVDDELYRNNNFLGFLQHNVKNIQLYGKTYMRIIIDENGNKKFVVYDPKEIIMFYNEFDEPILAIRYFTKLELDEKNKVKSVKYAEVFDEKSKDTWKINKKGKWEKDGAREYVYADKVVYKDAKGNIAKEETMSKDIPVFPIIEWRFNEECIPTLVNIKDFIDLQDTNLSDLANNVEDIQEAIWILENYNGQNLKEFMEDLKVKKAIKVGSGGSAHSETVQIPIEARNKLYELCDKNIYKFGFGVNFSERDSLGNVTGVALKWSYAPLEQKANSIENNGQEALNNFFNILFKLMGLSYDSNDLEFIFDRTMISNEQEQTATVMSASSQLSQKTILSNLPMVKDVEEEMKELEGEEEYEPTIQNEPVETGEDNEEEVELGDANSSNLPDNKSSKE